MEKKQKSGINQPIICKRCKKKVGYVRIKSRLRWRTIRWAIGIAFTFELIANIVVYLLFEI